MASEPIRDPKTDDLLTPQNSALVIIDYQPLQVNSIASMDRQLLVNHILAVAKTGVGYGHCGRFSRSTRRMTAPRSTHGRTWSSGRRSRV
jgi:hypothetical protein